MTTGGGVAAVTNTAPYSANSRFSTSDVNEDARSANGFAMNVSLWHAQIKDNLNIRLTVTPADASFKAG